MKKKVKKQIKIYGSILIFASIIFVLFISLNQQTFFNTSYLYNDTFTLMGYDAKITSNYYLNSSIIRINGNNDCYALYTYNNIYDNNTLNVFTKEQIIGGCTPGNAHAKSMNTLTQTKNLNFDTSKIEEFIINLDYSLYSGIGDIATNVHSEFWVILTNGDTDIILQRIISNNQPQYSKSGGLIINVKPGDGNTFITNINGETSTKDIPQGIYELAIYQQTSEVGANEATDGQSNIEIKKIYIKNKAETPNNQTIPGNNTLPNNNTNINDTLSNSSISNSTTFTKDCYKIVTNATSKIDSCIKEVKEVSNSTSSCPTNYYNTNLDCSNSIALGIKPKKEINYQLWGFVITGISGTVVILYYSYLFFRSKKKRR